MQIKALDAVTATTTSAGINVENIRDISFQFIASGISSGNGVFTIDISNDGTNWETSVAMISPTSTTPATRVTSVTLSTNVAVHGYLGKDFGAKMIRVKVVRTTDGTYTAVVFGNKIKN